MRHEVSLISQLSTSFQLNDNAASCSISFHQRINEKQKRRASKIELKLKTELKRISRSGKSWVDCPRHYLPVFRIYFTSDNVSSLLPCLFVCRPMKASGLAATFLTKMIRCLRNSVHSKLSDDREWPKLVINRDGNQAVLSLATDSRRHRSTMEQ